MPFFPWSAPGGVPEAGGAALDALLEGNAPPPGAAADLRPVAELIAVLNAAPAAGELTGQANALALFRGETGMSRAFTPSRRRRHPVLTSLLSTKLAAAAAVAAAAVGGTAAAAYAGALPASIQKVAHDTIGAPQASPSATPTPASTPVGPDATGHAAYGLCTAYMHMKAHGTAKQKAVAFRNLAAAAGGASSISSYCASVDHPGASSSASPAGKPSTMPSQVPSTHPAGKPSTMPSDASTSHPTGQPTSHPTGKPTSHA